DGYVLARLAREAGLDACVVRGAPPGAGPARLACAAFVAAGGEVFELDLRLPDCDVVVDAVLGIGADGTPRGPAAGLVAAINASSAPVLSLDAPSGVDVARGSVPGDAVRATHTLQMLVAHAGLRTGGVPALCGTLHVATLGLDAAALDGIAPVAWLLTAEALLAALPGRRHDAHKGDSGHVLCVGGDHGHGGAILLAVDAALRSGAGLASVATRGVHVGAVLSRRPEAMAHAVSGRSALRALLEAASVVALGPGLGQGAWGRALFAAVLARADQPLVLDADALNLLAATDTVLPPDAILTPHPGEAARLLSTSAAAIQADRFAALHALCARYGCIVVLKGAGTLIGGPDGRMRVVAAGNPGMAVGGMGDVLTGIVAALRAQGLEAFEAASLGALLHAVAGDAAARAGGMRGLLPSDVLMQLRSCLNP
ncbi:MAG TPA: NAD(P)H-hydrate dehydratase, partial [Luteimonas sp.]|nr:NAD(P)H-hydrate dehydratase [Luteimonas sp.]